MTGTEAYRCWNRTVFAILYGDRETILPEDAMKCLLPPDPAPIALQMQTPHSKRHAAFLKEWKAAKQNASV